MTQFKEMETLKNALKKIPTTKVCFKCLHYFVNRSRITPNLINFLVLVKDTNSTVGTGPCAKWFKGEDCPFYPVATIRQEFKVSCKDAEDSYCECIWFCWNNKDVYEMFDSTLKSEEFEDCTTRLTFSLILADLLGSS